MSSNNSFISKNQDAINAVGHTLNALQNAKIRDNQKKIAKLSAINASLQKESLQLNKQKVNLLEEQKKYFENKKKAEEQNALIKKLMLQTGPEIEDLTTKIKSELDNGNVYQDYLDVRFMLRFVKDNRGLIEDINYQRLINDQEKELKKLSNEIDLKSDSFKKLVFQTLQQNLTFLHSLNIFFASTQSDFEGSLADIKKSKEVLFELHQDPVKSAIISELLNLVSSHSLKLDDIDFDKSFLDSSQDLTGKIANHNFFQEEILKKFESAKNKISKKAEDKLNSYLKSKSIRGEDQYWDFEDVDINKVISIANHITKIEHEGLSEKYDTAFLLDHYIYNVMKHIPPKQTNLDSIPKEELIDLLISKTQLNFNERNFESRIDELEKLLVKLGRKFSEDYSTLYEYSKEVSSSKSYLDPRGKAPVYSKSDCFVVTATTGSSDNKIVNDFREFRDERLMNSLLGRVFISIYYRVGPIIAKIIEDSIYLRKALFKYIIKPLHSKLKRSEV